MTTDGIYARASARVDKELWKFHGKVFTSAEMHHECGCRPFDTDLVDHSKFRDAITRVLYEMCKKKKPSLRQVGKREYEVINRTRVPLLWATAERADKMLIYPKDRETEMELPFANTILIESGDVIAIAGESNRGKTALCLNFAVENIKDRDVFLWLSEYHPLQLQRRLAYFPEAYDYLSSHTFKLNVIDIAEQIAEDPDALHILDWVNPTKLPQGMWTISDFMEAVQIALGGSGLAIIAMQKIGGREKGITGDWGEFNTSLYMTLSSLDRDFVCLKPTKVKAYDGKNPENTKYRFRVVDEGARISEVDEIKNCRHCRGKGSKWVKGSGEVDCDYCEGRGYNVLSKDEEWF